MATKKVMNGGSLLCQDMAHNVLDDYNERLIDMVQSSTHGLSIDDIRAFLTDFKSNTLNEESSLFKEQFQRCLHRREQEVFDPTRREPFKRVLTMRFVDLFAPEGKLDDSGKYLSRRMLPGLFVALEKMVGADNFAQGHKSCMAILDSLKADGIIIWEDLYQHPNALRAVDDLLMTLITHFDNPMKRAMWMMQLINNELAPAHDYAFEGDANVDWQLDERGILRILRLLFRHLREQLGDAEHAKALAEIYDPGHVRAVAALLTTLDKAEV
ncbi:hypothetical protein ACFL12_00490 [Pseudomonadota bacterium]